MCLVDYLYLVEYFVLFSFSLGNGVNYFNEEPFLFWNSLVRPKGVVRKMPLFHAGTMEVLFPVPNEVEEPGHYRAALLGLIS